MLDMSSYTFLTKDTLLCKYTTNGPSNKYRHDVDVNEVIVQDSSHRHIRYPTDDDHQYMQWIKSNPMIEIGPKDYNDKNRFRFYISPIYTQRDLVMEMSRQDLKQLRDIITEILKD